MARVLNDKTGIVTWAVTLALLATVALFLARPGQVPAQGPAGIFGVAPQADLSADATQRLATLDPTVLRSRPVQVTLTNLGNADLPAGYEGVLLNLFDDVNLIAVKDSLTTDSLGLLVWKGHIKDLPGSSVIMSMQGDQVSANITAGDRHYQVRVLDGATHVVREIDQSQFKECGPLPTPPITGDKTADPTPSPDHAADAANNVAVLVVVSKQAAAASGNIYTEISTAMTETNTAYANSNVVVGGPNLTITVVKVIITDYSDSGDFNTDLNRLTGTADGYIDYIHNLRDQYNADCVVLIVENTQYCGLAWLHDPPGAGDASTAFAVVARSCATGYYSFGHELGHNMGLRHDCYVDSTIAPTANNHGYVDTVNRFRTVMSYNNKCSDLGFNCTRIQYFSNPGVTYSGNTTGSAGGGCQADNHTILQNTANTVANWRNSATSDTDGDGVPDSVDTTPADATKASPPSATGSGQISIDAGAYSLSGVQPLQDTDPTVAQTGKPSGYYFPDGLVKFSVTVPANTQITVTLTFPTTFPATAKYYMATAGGGFVLYPYAVISGNTVTLTLKDGDASKGDSDGAANGIIVDPGGVAMPTSSGSGTTSGGGGGGGGGGCFISNITDNH